MVEIDNDNELALENVPQRNDNNVAVFGEWGHTGFCHHCMQNMPNNPAKLNLGIDTTSGAGDIYVQLFEGLFSANLLDKWSQR